MDPFTIAAIGSGVGALGSVAGGYLSGRNSGQETKMQKTQRKLIDDLLLSLNGNGSYNDLFNKDDDSFQKSFVDPAKSLFQNQIAPQIQQQFIANGQQRGTGLDDTLTRAGVDLDQLLNQHMFDYQQGAMNRQQNTISNILGQGSGGTQNMSPGQSLAQSTSGYLSSPSFSDAVSGLFKNNPQTQNNVNPYAPPPRKGFEQDWSNWQLGDKRWGS